LAALDAAYFGSDIRETIDLIFGEFGWMANENPMQLDHMMRTIEASTERLMTQVKHQELCKISRNLVDSAFLARAGTGDWSIVDTQAESITVSIRNLVYSLSGVGLAGLNLGFAIKDWDHIAHESSDPISNTLRERFESFFRVLELSDSDLAEFNEDVKAFNNRGAFSCSEINNIPRKWRSAIKRVIISKCIQA
jgi:hypothetical protein